ncbi:hypothetical protein EOM82_07335 [bacterium]|nr:hypothetical protein [bacterium]
MMESVDMDRPIKKRDIKPKTYATTGTDHHEGRNIINSLGLDPVYLEKHNLALQAKYRDITKNEVKVEVIGVEDADYVIVAYGTVSRIARSAIDTLKEKGIKVGLIRPITLWPYPKKAFDLIPKTCKGILVAEMSMGQMLEDVKLAIEMKKPVRFYGRCGGNVMTPEDIVKFVKEEVK